MPVRINNQEANNALESYTLFIPGPTFGTVASSEIWKVRDSRHLNLIAILFFHNNISTGTNWRCSSPSIKITHEGSVRPYCHRLRRVWAGRIEKLWKDTSRKASLKSVGVKDFVCAGILCVVEKINCNKIRVKYFNKKPDFG